MTDTLPTGTTPTAELNAPTRAEILRADSRPISIITVILGGAALVVSLLFTFAFVLSQGVMDYEVVAASLMSPTFAAICIVAIALGAFAVAIGALVYRSMPTRTARNQAIAGLVLGLQAICAAVIELVFVQGDMTVFARNFINLPDVVSWLPFFLVGMGNTLILTISSTALGILLGIVIAVFLISENKIVRAPARIYVNLVRGTPILLQLAIVYFGLALGLGIKWSPGVALVVTLGLNAGAYMAEVFRAGLQSIERGQLDAARGLGMSYPKTLTHVLIPQATRRVIPPLMNDFITITKETSLIAFLGITLGGRELYTVATQGYSQFFNSTFFVAAGIGYLIITLPLIGLVNLVEKRIRSGLVSVGS